jgi:hypothetical protein
MITTFAKVYLLGRDYQQSSLLHESESAVKVGHRSSSRNQEERERENEIHCIKNEVYRILYRMLLNRMG